MGCGFDGNLAAFESPLTEDLAFHQLALILSATFMCLSVSISCWLILDHALHYLKPYEQKHIIRILAVVPTYSILSFLSLLFYDKAVYLELLRSCYDAFAIASYFTLMCHYIAPSLHEQKEYFRNVRPKPWIFPLRNVAIPRSGLTWFNILYIGIFQFCVTRPLFAVIAFATQQTNLYCAYSSEPDKAHTWISLLQGAFVLVAMYCLSQFHKQLNEDLEAHKPALKLHCVKLVTFLCFWQNWLFGILAGQGVLRATPSIADVDILVGFPCMLICFEMTIFAGLYHWAFPYTPYDIDHQLRGSERPTNYTSAPHKAIVDAMNPWDYVKAAARGLRWLFHGVRHRRVDASYQDKEEEDSEKESELEYDTPQVVPGWKVVCTDPDELLHSTDRGPLRGV
ncbi:hypothetical protein SNOG_13028 [Parastagonospora nodorum SN15]|nr:hypothetical protein SNOG_13028 [Parastagonospora nodorum SN15]EAT79828.2 hypothetical protein SNOG_13028 [Parastagonospora nodorum SN15]